MTDFESLERAAELHRQGVITDDEFAQEKARLLGPAPKAPRDGRQSQSLIVVVIVVLVTAAIACAAWLAFRDRGLEAPQPAPSAIAAPQPTPTPVATDASPTPTASSTSTAAEGEARQGNCHMGECSWSRELKRETIDARTSGRLIRLSLLGGTSDDQGSAIKWDRAPHAVYVFCSLALPSTILELDGGWQVDVLDLAGTLPDVMFSSAMLYGDTCHPRDAAFPNDAAALGYRPIPEERQSVTITKPSDIFDRADS